MAVAVAPMPRATASVRSSRLADGGSSAGLPGVSTDPAGPGRWVMLQPASPPRPAATTAATPAPVGCPCQIWPGSPAMIVRNPIRYSSPRPAVDWTPEMTMTAVATGGLAPHLRNVLYAKPADTAEPAGMLIAMADRL